MQARRAAHLVQEGELVGEFLVDVGVGLVAAGGDVEIVQRRRLGKPGLRADRHGDMAAVGLAAEAADVDCVERHPRDDGDAVIALLPVEREMGVAHALEALERKPVVGALGFLEAQHVRLRGAQEPRDEIDAQPHRIDVPGGDGQAHGLRVPVGRPIARCGRTVRS